MAADSANELSPASLDFRGATVTHDVDGKPLFDPAPIERQGPPWDPHREYPEPSPPDDGPDPELTGPRDSLPPSVPNLAGPSGYACGPDCGYCGGCR